MNIPRTHSRGLRPLRALVPLLASGLLAACAVAPTGSEGPVPALSLPPAWQASLPPAKDTALPAADQVWAGLNDPVLPRLVQAAQRASPTLASAAARIERARAARVSAGATLWPTVDGVAAAQQSRAVPYGSATASLSLGLQAGWEIDLFGGLAAAREAAQARLQSAQLGLQDGLLSVAAETASSYVALRACEALRVQAQADADSRIETSRLTELSARAGFTPPADAALARAGAAQARNQAVSQQAACDTLVKSLVELTDSPEPELRAQLAALTAQLPQPTPFSAADTLPASLLSRRPDLAQAERAVVAAAGDRTQAQARQRPSVTLRGSLAAVAGRESGISGTGATWSIGPLQVDFPLFDAGSRAAASAAAQASYDEAVAQYRGLARRAVREVEAARVDLQSSALREADALQAASDFETSLRATAALQQGGLASLFDLEAARRNAVAAQRALIDLRRERAAAWIALVRALGGGWQAATSLAEASPANR